MKALFVQFIKFGLVGASSTLVNIGVYTLSIFFGFHPIAANTLGYIIATYNGFFWQCKFVFKGKRTFKRMLKTYIAYLPGLVVSSTMIMLLIRAFKSYGMDEQTAKYCAQVPTMCVTIPINFLINKIWASNEKLFDKGEVNGKG